MTTSDSSSEVSGSTGGASFATIHPQLAHRMYYSESCVCLVPGGDEVVDLFPDGAEQSSTGCGQSVRACNSVCGKHGRNR